MRCWVIAAIAAGAVVSSTAYAQSEKTAAAFAFKKGKELMNAGQIAEACAAFAQSEKLDPQLGTQYNLARCFEKQGKLASAWINYTELAAKDSNAGRRDDSTRRATALEPRLPKMMLEVHATDGLVVTLDGVDVTVLAGVESPIDPGVHTIQATAPAVPAWSKQIDFHVEGQTVKVEVPALAKAAAEPAKPAPPPPKPVAVTTTPKPVIESRPAPRPETTGTAALTPSRAPAPVDVAAHAEPSGGLSGTQKLGIGGLGLGAATVVVGGLVHLAASSKPGQAAAICGGPLDGPCLDPMRRAQADQKLADQKSLNTDSVILFGVGGGLLVVGGILLLSGSADKPAQPHAAFAPVVAPDRVGVAYSGAW